MDGTPYIKNGRIYIPVRFLSDGLNAQTSYNNGIVTIVRDNTTV